MDNPPPGFEPASFAPGFLQLSGPYFVSSEDSHRRLGLRIGDAHANYLGAAHGGVLATFADVALSFAIHDSERPALNVVSSSLTVNFLGAVRTGDWLEASCRIDRKGKRTAYASGEIRRGDEAVMTMTGVYSIIA